MWRSTGCEPEHGPLSDVKMSSVLSSSPNSASAARTRPKLLSTFAEDAADVAGLVQAFGKRDFGQVHVGSLAIHVGDARAKVVTPGHQRRLRRRADRADVELREFRRLASERVDLRRLDVQVPVASHIAVAQIVDEKEDHVRFVKRLRRLGGLARR